MVTIVVPHRRRDAKRRLTLDGGMHEAVVEAMLSDVLEACRAVGPTAVADGPGGQGAAVALALASVKGQALVVNSDLPCATADDLVALLAAVPEGGLALVEARDGTTNALALDSAQLFVPVYGSGSAARFRALAPSRTVDLPNLVDDVDTPDDLHRLAGRLGRRTQAAIALAA
jgi:2-phospho-L-lactate guanylyltransferase (CobY/MobA/RfbA family)